MLGAAALQKTGEPFFALVLLVVMKIGLDGYAHCQQHLRRAQTGAFP